MVHDIFIPFVADKLRRWLLQNLDPDRMVLIYDHLVPASRSTIPAISRRATPLPKYGVKMSTGLTASAPLMTEAGYVKPGDIAFGTDSHTTTYGCVGAFSTGSATRKWRILGTGKSDPGPETIRVQIDGTLPDNVTSKDVILRILGDLRADGATYKSSSLPAALSKP